VVEKSDEAVSCVLCMHTSSSSIDRIRQEICEDGKEHVALEAVPLISAETLRTVQALSKMKFNFFS
jgi:hypothetical protein